MDIFRKNFDTHLTVHTAFDLATVFKLFEKKSEHFFRTTKITPTSFYQSQMYLFDEIWLIIN